jgi:glutamate/tyrosine decarboxylase-like PLP-dependent enzyme
MSHQHKEETLDPEDWDEFRALGHRMLDDMLNGLENIREHQFKWTTEEEINNILAPLTPEGEGESKVYEILGDNALNCALACVKPTFWGAVAGTGSPYGILADMFTSFVNNPTELKPFPAGYTHQQVVDWVKELLEFSEDVGGVLVEGGSEANFTGLAVARNAMAKNDMKTEGIYGQPEKMVLYCSDETHDCIDRSVELLGLGNMALRWLPTDENSVLRIESLKKAVHEDKNDGLHPFCVIGNAGTVNTGAFDDFKKLRKIADKEDLWFHVDGAFGAWVKLSDSHSHLADGMELADSLAVDLHKWMNVPYGIGCALVRDKVAHYSTFVYGHDAEYLRSGLDLSDDITGNPNNLRLQLTGSVRSYKAYMLLRAYGSDKYRRLVQKNIDQINYFGSLIEGDEDMELMAPVISNIVCFRYNTGGLDEKELEKLNRGIAQDIWTRINFWVFSDTMLKGIYVLRACNVNHRTRFEDIDFVFKEILKTGERLSETNSR